MPQCKAINIYKMLLNCTLLLSVVFSNIIMINFAQARERVFTYSSIIKVLPNRSLDVTETITVNVENKKIRHGIFRDFETTRINRNDQKVNVSLKIISVKRNGVKEPYHTRKQDGKIRVFFGSKSKIVSKGIQTYIFRYVTDNQLNAYKNKDEFYWNASGNKWSMDIFRVEATIVLPEKVARKSISIKAYSGYSGVNKQDYVSTFVNNHTIKFALNRKYITGNGLTIAIAWPKGLIQAAEPIIAKPKKSVIESEKKELTVKLATVKVTDVVVTKNKPTTQSENNNAQAKPAENTVSSQSNTTDTDDHTKAETNIAAKIEATDNLKPSITVIPEPTVNSTDNTELPTSAETEVERRTDLLVESQQPELKIEHSELDTSKTEHPELLDATILNLSNETLLELDTNDSAQNKQTLTEQVSVLLTDITYSISQFNLDDYFNTEYISSSHFTDLLDIKNLTLINFIALLGFMFLLLYFGIVRLILLKPDLETKVSTTQESEHIPDDLSPASIRYIYEMGYDDRTFSIALINIAVKGHIDIIDNEDCYKIERRDFSAAVQLSKDEKLLISSLMGSNSEIQLSSTNHKIIRDAMTKHQNILEADHKSKYFTTNKKWFNIGVAITFIIAITNAVLESTLIDAVVKIALISGFCGLAYFTSILVLDRFKFFKNYKSSLLTNIKMNQEIQQSKEAFIFALLAINATVVFVLASYIHPINIVAFAAISLLGAIMIDSLISPNMKGKNILNRIGDLKEFITQGDQLDDIAQYDSMQYSQTISAFDDYLPYTIALGVEAEWGDHYSLLFDHSDDVGYSPHWYHGSGWQENSTTSFCKSLSSKFSFSAGAAANAPKHEQTQSQIKH